MLKKVMIFSLCLVFALASSASANTWTGANSDDWLDVLNWDNGVPAEGPITSGAQFGAQGDVIMSTTATFQPVANAGETIGAADINNFLAPVLGGVSVITFESGSFGDFFNMSGALSDPTGDINYDIQAGAVVSVSNQISHHNAYGTVTVGGLLQAIGDGQFTGNYANNGAGLLDVLEGGLVTVQGDDTVALDALIGGGLIVSSSPGFIAATSYDAGSDTTSIFAVVPEPSTCVLLVMAGLVGLIGRRR